MGAGIKLSIPLEKKKNHDFNCHFDPLMFSKLFNFCFDKIFAYRFSHQQQTKKRFQLLPVKSMQAFLLIIFHINLHKAKPVFTEETQ